MFLRQKMKPIFVPTDVMRADDKTKVVHKLKLFFCRKYQMNLREEDV